MELIHLFFLTGILEFSQFLWSCGRVKRYLVNYFIGKKNRVLLGAKSSLQECKEHLYSLVLRTDNS